MVTCEIRFEYEWGRNYTILDTEGRFYDALEGVGGSRDAFFLLLEQEELDRFSLYLILYMANYLNY